MRRCADRVRGDMVCLGAPFDFYAAGRGYDDFFPTSDAQVCALPEAHQ